MTDYRGHHTAPLREGANTLDDVSDCYPIEDFANPSVAARYYGHGGGSESMDLQSAKIVSHCIGKPEMDVTIYRAVPKSADDKIHCGDWVTINKQYAIQHGNSWIDEPFKILSTKVKVNSLTTDGNSIHEWGFSPIDEQSIDCKEDISLQP